MRKSSLTARCGGLLLTCLAAGPSWSANFGTDLNLTMMPAAGAMGGVGISNPQDIGASVFGNPATLTSMSGTTFTFGGTYYTPKVSVTHDGSATGTPWSGDSEAGPYLVPTAAVSRSFGADLVIAGGLTVVSGIGSDFRNAEGSLGSLAEILVFGANAGAAYRLSDDLSAGLMLTIGMGLGQAGLVSNTASTSNFGGRVTLGINYGMDPLKMGAYYRSGLAIKYDNMIQYSATEFHSPTFEQPAEIGLGISYNGLLQGRLLLAADLVLKDWSSAETYNDLYDDQTMLALGVQYTLGPYRIRGGFIHANNPIKDPVDSSVGDIDSLFVGGSTVPFNSVLTQYVQATNAEVIWEDQVTFGLGIDLGGHSQLDIQAGVTLEAKETIGANKVEASSWQLGAGFSWQFQ
jgi:long-chain fatty acid transport protein